MQRFTHKFFVYKWAITFSGIKQCDTAINR
jgi:hypothetical protein